MNEAWEKKWAELVAAELDPTKGKPGGCQRYPRALVYVDGKLLTESRLTRPGEYLWTAPPGPATVPIFKHPMRSGSVISIVLLNGGLSGNHVNERFDYVVTVKLAGAGERVPCSYLGE